MKQKLFNELTDSIKEAGKELKMFKDNLTQEDFDKQLKILQDKDPQFELKSELGKLLMIPIEEFTKTQKERYEQLHKILGIPLCQK